jgi:hypothetical protein
VTCMKDKFEDVKFLFPNESIVEDFFKQNAIEPFSDYATNFLNALSYELKTYSRSHPEVASFAFFCRKANINAFKTKFSNQSQKIRLGRGIVFHIAPSNVPMNFAYSLVCGILSGNCNIVRVPFKEFDQVSIVCEALKKIQLSGLHNEITSRILLIRYERQKIATAYFCAMCDACVIWGGDKTIAEIRENEIPAKAFYITFANRYSFCIINADHYVKEPNPKKIANGFFNDTYLHDQNACTSPHLIIWIGSKNNVMTSKEIFWNELHKIVIKKYPSILPVTAVDKLTSFYVQARAATNISKIVTDDNQVWRIKIEQLSPDIDEYRCSSGYFSEYHATSFLEISGIINRSYQTLAYFGFTKQELIDFIIETKPVGIDRIVPIGHTTDFSLIWDGFDLISTLSRTIEIL